MVSQESREDLIARIKEQADIVQIIGEHVQLKKSGARYLGLCPFHGEKTPSFTVHPGQQMFHCFGCHESGDVFSFVMKHGNLDFPAAVKELAQRYHISLPEQNLSREEGQRRQRREQMLQLNAKVAGIYRKHLQQQGDGGPARNYLEQRGIPEAVQEKFAIGYAPAVAEAGWDFLGSKLSVQERALALELGLLVQKDRGGTYDRFRGRVLFPIADGKGAICGFGGRILGDEQPKYMNSPESLIFNKSRLLLGLYQQQEAIRRTRQAVLVEGNFDMVSLVCHGCEQVVAPLGTALTREQLRLLKHYAEDVVLLFDGDAAGIKAAERAVPLFFSEQMTGRVALLPAGHDPDSFVRAEGLAAVQQLLASAQSLPEFFLAQLIARYSLSLDGKRKILDELQVLVKAAASKLHRAMIISHFAERLGMAAAEMEQYLGQAAPLPVALREQPRREPVRELPQTVNSAQKRLLGFMILHPDSFQELAAGGLRDCLVGSIGEVLFLQMQALLEQKVSFEPEDLLGLLPEGAERRFVVELLGAAAQTSTGGVLFGDPVEELAEMLGWIDQHRLAQRSAQLLEQIGQAQENGDLSLLGQLLQQKQSIDQQLRGIG